MVEPALPIGDPCSPRAWPNSAISTVRCILSTRSSRKSRDRTGQERHYYAEALRIKGWLLSLKGDPAGAERAYIASLDWARTQQAKSWELRTATSYARLMRDQGRVGEAYDLLAPVYGWFTEGFGTKDLKDAKALLRELSAEAHREVSDIAATTSGEPI